jgi:alpha-amylase
MLKMNLIIGMYNHLPEGLPDGDFERVYQTCYRPFLSVLNRFPDIQAALFFSGSLLKRLETRHPEYLMLLEEMTARRQIELLGGGFYAPILPLIPASDRLGQIELLTTYLRKSFGKRPRGCFLSEYAWEPWLASTLQTCGMDYTFLTEGQFKTAMGGKGDHEAVITEDQGRCITVFPSFDCSQSFDKPLGFDEAIRRIAGGEKRSLAVLMAPGEGLMELWERSGLESPDIYIERTLAWLRNNALDMETIVPARYLKAKKSSVRAYFPGTASKRYSADSAAALDSSAPASQPSLRNAILRSAASASLYSRMYYVHLIIGQLRGDRSRKKTASEDLWRGQCGDAYWSAPNGGIALPLIREAAYKALLDAEQTTRIKGSFKPGILRADTDFDGQKEIIYQGSELNAYLHLRGAALTELDILKTRKNLCDIFAGDFHDAKARKASFVDRVYMSEPESQAAAAPWEGDTRIYSSAVFDELLALASHHGVTLYKEGIINHKGTSRLLALRKEFSFHKKCVSAGYTLGNKSDSTARFWLGIEFNFALLPEQLKAVAIDGVARDAAGLCPGVGEFRSLAFQALDSQYSLSLQLSLPAMLALAPISYADPGGSPIEQGYCALLLWKIELEPDQEWNLAIGLNAGE